ncbi:WD repeat-containing protein 5 [Hondaea fermentalgiana]|uniref:WD repeat-containing protein 5 n=1 Tax=Hondaea fermentalgiana TaxID=2315210 RepID=A0A2R5G3B7_9STRA|nr:WD repeat-containing protein 5 [Hondaea fermentalgiana]|eukprot:GBG25500.1 WD repeat-containing protein 5 [Hondaea fermentalgiana]
MQEQELQKPRESRLGAYLRLGDPALVACIAEFLTPEDLAHAFAAVNLMENSFVDHENEASCDGTMHRLALAEAVALLAAQVEWVRAIAEAGQLQTLGDLIDKSTIHRPGLAKAFQRIGHRGESSLPFLEEHLYVQLVPTLGERDDFVQRLDVARHRRPGLHAQWSEMLDPKAYFEHGEMTCMSASASIIASGSREGILQLNDLDSGRLILREPVAPAGEPLVKVFALSPWRVACAWKSSLALVRTGDLLPGEERVVVLTDDHPEISGSARVTCMTRVDRHANSLVLATGWSDGIVRLWDASTGECIGSCKGHQGPVTALCALRQGRNGADLASASTDCTIRMWRCRVGPGQMRGRGVLRGHAGPVQTLATMRLPDSRHEILVSGSRDTSVRLWDVRHGLEVGVCRGHRGVVVSVSCTRDGHILSSSWDRSWILFDLSGRIIAKYQHKRGVQFVRVVNDTLVVSVSTDNVIHMVDIRTGACLATWENPNCICAVEVIHVDPVSPQDLVVFGCRAGRIGVYK